MTEVCRSQTGFDESEQRQRRRVGAACLLDRDGDDGARRHGPCDRDDGLRSAAVERSGRDGLCPSRPRPGRSSRRRRGKVVEDEHGVAVGVDDEPAGAASSSDDFAAGSASTAALPAA